MILSEVRIVLIALYKRETKVSFQCHQTINDNTIINNLNN